MQKLLSLAALLAAMVPTGEAQANLDVTTRVSLGVGGIEGNERSLYPQTSIDGRWVAFQSLASNFVPGDTNNHYDVFLRDTLTGAIELVGRDSAGTPGIYGSDVPRLSQDGRFVAFSSISPGLVPGDTSSMRDVFLRDVQASTLQRVNLTPTGGEPNGASELLALSAGGDKVVFWSLATNLVPGDTNGLRDLFLFDANTGRTERISLDSAGNQLTTPVQPPPLGNPHPWYEGAGVSSDGRFVVFATNSPDLDPLESDADQDVFLRDRTLGTTTRISVGLTVPDTLGESLTPSISPDGRWITFFSQSADLVTGDTNGTIDIFLYDRLLANLERVSLNSYEQEANGPSMRSSVSSDGRYVAFMSLATNLSEGDSNGFADIFVRDRDQGVTLLRSRASGGAQRNGTVDFAALSGDGGHLFFLSSSTNLVAGDTNTATDVFRVDLLPGGAAISVAGLAAGQTATLLVQGAVPTSTLLIGMSLAGQGGVGSPWGLINLAPPIWIFPLIADTAGSAQLSVPIPPGLTGLPVWIQGIDTVSSWPTATFGALIQ
jgi:Tol biopolymer transport system component